MNTATELANTYLNAFDAADAILTAIVNREADEDAAEPELSRLDAERDKALETLAHLPARTIQDLKAKAAVAEREDEHFEMMCDSAEALRRSIWRDIAALEL